MASTCALLVAALYFAQPLTSSIARDLSLPPESAGLLVTLTQLGYCAGLLLITPLGDKVDNRRLVLSTMCCSGAALLAAAFAPGAPRFLVASFLVGLPSCAVHILVPLAAHMAAIERRGRVLGIMTSGLLFGILLARPVSSALGGL